jgi:hypothetical protein
MTPGDERYQMTPDDERNQIYTTASDHWMHAEQVRWTIVYNFLVAATILVLAWAAFFASAADSPLATFLLVLLSVVGVVLSGLWFCLVCRGNEFVDIYATFGRGLEDKMEAKPGPFIEAAQKGDNIGRDAGQKSHGDSGRGRNYWNTFCWSAAGKARTRDVTPFVPILFAILFFVLFIASVVLLFSPLLKMAHPATAPRYQAVPQDHAALIVVDTTTGHCWTIDSAEGKQQWTDLGAPDQPHK